MKDLPPADFGRAVRRHGLHYRLPDHRRDFVIVWWLVTMPACCLIGFFSIPAHSPLVVLLPVGCVLFMAMILLAGPLEWHLFRGHCEFLLTADRLTVWRKAGPFWRRWSVPLGELRHLFLVAPASDTPGRQFGVPCRLFACCARRRIPLSHGEPTDLLRRLLADLAAECSRRRQELGLPALPAVEAEEVRFCLGPAVASNLHLCDGRLVLEYRYGLFRKRRSVPLDDLERLTLVDPAGRNLHRLVAVCRGHPPLTLVPLGERRGLMDIGGRLAGLCCFQARRAVPLTEELNIQPERPLQPVYSRVHVGWKDGRRVYTIHRRGSVGAPVRIILHQDELLVELPFLWLRTTHRWFAEELVSIEAVTWTHDHGEGGGSTVSHGLTVRPLEGRPVPVTGLERRDCEWLAAVLRRWLSGPAGGAPPGAEGAGAGPEAIRLRDDRLHEKWRERRGQRDARTAFQRGSPPPAENR